MLHSSPQFVGKQKFTDTLFIASTSGTYAHFQNDFVDRHSDALSADCFDLMPDYSSSVYRYDYYSKDPICYYPVYMVNQTPDAKAVIGKDDHAFGLQEALDKDGQWRPIEATMSEFCGVGHWRLKVHSQEFITLLFPKYSGNFKTKIRVRINNGDNVFISKPYDGTISESQFYMTKETYLYETSSQEEAKAFQRMFYGAKPPLLTSSAE